MQGRVTTPLFVLWRYNLLTPELPFHTFALSQPDFEKSRFIRSHFRNTSDKGLCRI